MMISKQALAHLREMYKPGTRIQLCRMDDPFTKLKPGDLGTVWGVDDTGSLLIRWDCGSSLNLLFGVDECRIIETANSAEGNDD